MSEQYNVITAMAAFLLAILFPIYWVGEFWHIAESGGAAVYRNVSTLSLSDLLFLLNGVLGIFVYLGIKRFLNERYAFSKADVVFVLLVIVTAVFTVGTLAMDATLHFYGDQLFLGWHVATLNGVTVSLIVSLVVFGILDLILGVMLLSNAKEMSGGVVAFAIITIIQGVVEFTVIFSLTTIVVYPIALLVIGIVMLIKPQELEVV